MKKLLNKVAVITGASKGIGASIAKHFAAEGAYVVVNYASDKAGAEAVVENIKKAGGTAIAVKANVRDLDDVKKLFEETKARFGKLDIIVNNAGIYEFAPLDEITAESFHRQFDTNVLGLIQVTREGVKYMGSEGGSIINMSSIAGRKPSTTNSVYAATKGAVDSLTIAYSQELGPKKIRVNGLCPGMVETEGFTATGLLESDWLDQAVKITPLGRIAQPEDIAKAAVFFASDESGWVTGESVLLAGGRR